MIQYTPGKYAIAFAFQLSGSILPRAMVWAVPASILSGLLQLSASHFGWKDYMSFDDLDGGMTAYTFILTFLLSFRASLAYGRLWDGMSSLQMMRGAWTNMVSSCIAFSSTDENLRHDVESFQQQIARLVSVMHAAALQSVSVMANNSMEVLDYHGLDSEGHISWLASRPDRAEIVAQWIRHLIVDMHERRVLRAPPPILSRAIQELDRGIVDLNNARRINLVPFPFPYAQMVTFALLLHTLFATATGFNGTSAIISAFQTFTNVVVVWAVNFVACEIEAPFGDDLNDIPLFEMQQDMNCSLRFALHPLAVIAPVFHYDEHQHELFGSDYIYRYWHADDSGFIASRAPARRHEYKVQDVTAGKDGMCKRPTHTPGALHRGASDPSLPALHRAGNRVSIVRQSSDCAPISEEQEESPAGQAAAPCSTSSSSSATSSSSAVCEQQQRCLSRHWQSSGQPPSRAEQSKDDAGSASELLLSEADTLTMRGDNIEEKAVLIGQVALPSSKEKEHRHPSKGEGLALSAVDLVEVEALDARVPLERSLAFENGVLPLQQATSLDIVHLLASQGRHLQLLGDTILKLSSATQTRGQLEELSPRGTQAPASLNVHKQRPEANDNTLAAEANPSPGNITLHPEEKVIDEYAPLEKIICSPADTVADHASSCKAAPAKQCRCLDG
eukprot:TRINITY_DN50372_c0_g1_i2.p1 TRINITY_DN50372_c0_g1~~TRINITY_DN50372_c0_g1_i2.p1  ORF type:complete len:674 (-),score=92.96 TRINITY_DN50372_c0_g1_i2:505-2526(-)